MARLTRLVAALLLLFVALPARAQTFPKIGASPVVDQAHLLTAAQTADISSKAEALYARTGRKYAVATVSSLEGRTIEDYGYRLGREWALGDKDKDDGVILLVAPNERKVRIETGYGARVFLTDAVSSVIIRERIVPRFKQNDYGGGIVAGTDAILQMMELPAAEAAKRASEIGAREQQASRDSGGGFPFVFIFFILFFVVLPLLRAVGGRRYKSKRGRRGGIDPWVVLWGLNELGRGSHGGGWGGGGGSWGGGGGGGFGGGGGSWGGGGGSFGGGGASGGW